MRIGDWDRGSPSRYHELTACCVSSLFKAAGSFQPPRNHPKRIPCGAPAAAAALLIAFCASALYSSFILRLTTRDSRRCSLTAAYKAQADEPSKDSNLQKPLSGSEPFYLRYVLRVYYRFAGFQRTLSLTLGTSNLGTWNILIHDYVNLHDGHKAQRG